MRVIFCGSGSFAVPALGALLPGPHEVVMVVTQPSRPSGRGGHLAPTPMAQACAGACAYGQASRVGRFASGASGSAHAATWPPCWECENINDPSAVQKLADARADVMVVADFGQFIKGPARAAMRVDSINLHGSLLPELRGAAPINWAIMRGHKATGVTTFSLVDKMDAGDVYLQESLEIDPAWTAQDLREQLAEVGAGVVRRTLDLLASGQGVRRAQDHAKATLAPLLKKSDGIIDWSQDATAIRNRIHGCWPWPGAQAVFVRADGRQAPVTIARAEVVDAGNVAGDSEDMPAPAAANGGMAPGAGAAVAQCVPGAITAELTIATGHGGVLRVMELKPAGKRLMAWRDFVNGHRVAAGDRFATN